MLIAVDTETTGLDLRHGCKPFIVATCDEEGRTRVWEWPVKPDNREVIVNIQEVSEIRSYLKGHTLIFHNAKFDLRALSTINLFFDFQEDRFSTYTLSQLPEDGRSPVDPFAKRTQEAEKQLICLPIFCQTFHDTLLMSHALRTEDEHGLKELCLRYLRYSDLDELELKKEVERCTRVAKKKCPEIMLGHSPTGDRMTGYDYWIPRFAEPDNDVCVTYATKDVERTMLLYHFFIDLLDDEEEQVRYGYEREKRLMQTVYRMEDGGVTVNPKTIKSKIRKAEKCSQEYLKNCSDLMRKKLRGTKTYNPRSQKDLTSYLYSPEGWKQTPPKMTEKGSPSTDKASLEALIESLPEDKQHKELREFLGMFLQAKSHLSAIGYLKNYQSYARPLHKPLSIPEEFRNREVLYPSLNQTGTKTTRFSSSNPNGQNVSKISTIEIAGQTYEGPKIREVFSPLELLEWWAIDYSQLELRVFAACSEEQSLIDTLDDGYDFHSFVAERIFKKPPDKITKQERRIAKNVNFALIFGASPKKVNLTAGIPNAYELFAKQFPNVASYMEKMIAHAKKHRCVRTLDGYRLGVPADSPYKAVNYIVQGTAGSIIKNAMIDIDSNGLVDWDSSRIVLQIHDELIIETRKDSPKARSAVARIIKAMENSGARLGINTPVSCERIVKNWGSGEETPRNFFFRAKQRKASHA